jgi:hypothetical protein
MKDTVVTNNSDLTNEDILKHPLLYIVEKHDKAMYTFILIKRIKIKKILILNLCLR